MEAKDTERSTGQYEKKPTPGGVFITIDGSWRSVVDKSKASVQNDPWCEGRPAQAWINVNGALQVFATYSRHSACWSQLNDTVYSEYASKTHAIPLTRGV